MKNVITDKDKKFLKRCVELAKEALGKGDEPFGSVLVSQDGKVLYEGHNEVSFGDTLKHPEFAIAKWALYNLSEEERKNAVVYTSGEHCPMCAAAHGWAGLGKIVYAASSKQLTEWLDEIGADLPRVKTLPINEVITNTVVLGPVEEFAETLKSYHQESYLKKQEK